MAYHMLIALMLRPSPIRELGGFGLDILLFPATMLLMCAQCNSGIKIV